MEETKKLCKEATTASQFQLPNDQVLLIKDFSYFLKP